MMLHRLEMVQGYVPPVVEAVESCSTCFHCDGNTTPICGWLRDTRLYHNILPLPDICTYFQYRHSTCKEIFPTWDKAEYWLSKLVEESYYDVRIFRDGRDWRITLLTLPEKPGHSRSHYRARCITEFFPLEYLPIVEQILNDVVSEYYPSHYLIKPFLQNLGNFQNDLALADLIKRHVKYLEDSGQTTLKEALRRAFGLGLMQGISFECKITCDGGLFEKK